MVNPNNTSRLNGTAERGPDREQELPGQRNFDGLALPDNLAPGRRAGAAVSAIVEPVADPALAAECAALAGKLGEKTLAGAAYRYGFQREIEPGLTLTVTAHVPVFGGPPSALLELTSADGRVVASRNPGADLGMRDLEPELAMQAWKLVKRAEGL